MAVAGEAAGQPAARAATASVSGRVFERGTINPVAGARVLTSGATGATAETNEVTTDARGAFTLAAPPGELELLVVSDAHEPLRQKVKVGVNKPLELELRLIPKAASRKYESTVRGRQTGAPISDKFELRGEELRNAPGTLGDPVRVIGLLPGVATPIPVLPVYVVRGASPGSNGFFLDGMRVPQLFHFVVGTGIAHPRLIDKLDFYPGTYDATFGRTTGAVINAETRKARDGYHADVELRLYDLSALGEVTLPHDVRVSVAGHYGYPTFLIKLINPDVALQYGDYSLRLDWKGFTFEALGSYDELKVKRSFFTGGRFQDAEDTLRLQFHRLQARWRGRKGNVSYETAIHGGYDQFTTFGGASVDKWSIGWRANLRARWKIFSLAVGTDGEISEFRGNNFQAEIPRQSPDQLGALAGRRVGSVVGLYAQGQVELLPEQRAQLVFGGRADVYHAGGVTLLGLEPRLLLRSVLQRWLEIRAGVGLYQQPPSFPVALPGIDTFALQLGLQRSIQSSVTIETRLPQSISVQITGYYSRLYNLNDVTIDLAGPAACTSPPPESLSGLPALITRQIDGQSYGMEMMVRRSAGRVTGWIAYTLARSERRFSCGLRPADFDQNHILNFVLQVRLPWRLLVGARLNVSSGRPYTTLRADGTSTTRNDARLPTYVQLDLRIDRDWVFKKWQLALFLEVVNATYSNNVLGVEYPEIGGVPLFTQPKLNGFRWILPSIGFRGYF